jgi:hypothetical protein
MQINGSPEYSHTFPVRSRPGCRNGPWTVTRDAQHAVVVVKPAGGREPASSE